MTQLELQNMDVVISQWVERNGGWQLFPKHIRLLICLQDDGKMRFDMGNSAQSLYQPKIDALLSVLKRHGLGVKELKEWADWIWRSNRSGNL